jgi:hypothetical protein
MCGVGESTANHGLRIRFVVERTQDGLVGVGAKRIPGDPDQAIHEMGKAGRAVGGHVEQFALGFGQDSGALGPEHVDGGRNHGQWLAEFLSDFRQKFHQLFSG